MLTHRFIVTTVGLEAQLDEIVAAGVTGAAAVARGPDRHLEGAAGVADLRTRERLTIDHRFRIASVTKTFVAAVVLQLADEGAFGLDDEAAPFVEGITVRQLLNHTSGLPEFYDDLVELFEPYRQDRGYRSSAGERELLEQVLAKPRLFAPGESWSYSNSASLVLELFLEEVTGVPLADELRRRIFQPVGLAATDYAPSANALDVARGYCRRRTRLSQETLVRSTSPISPCRSPARRVESSRRHPTLRGDWRRCSEATFSRRTCAPSCSTRSCLTGKRAIGTGSGSRKCRRLWVWSDRRAAPPGVTSVSGLVTRRSLSRARTGRGGS